MKQLNNPLTVPAPCFKSTFCFSKPTKGFGWVFVYLLLFPVLVARVQKILLSSPKNLHFYLSNPLWKSNTAYRWEEMGKKTGDYREKQEHVKLKDLRQWQGLWDIYNFSTERILLFLIILFPAKLYPWPWPDPGSRDPTCIFWRGFGGDLDEAGELWWQTVKLLQDDDDDEEEEEEEEETATTRTRSLVTLRLELCHR